MATIVSGVSNRGLDDLTADDFETASIRSAAPSYVSEVPSYHSTIPGSESTPPYPGMTQGNRRLRNEGIQSVPVAMTPTPRRPTGLPPVPSGPAFEPGQTVFSIPTWPTFSANPAIRQYHNVAQRRVAAAKDRVERARRTTLGILLEEEEERNRELRIHEDPYMVGEEAARQAREAREARIARERRDEILIEADRRWDWLLSQAAEWDARERTWARFRQELSSGRRKKLTRYLGGSWF